MVRRRLGESDLEITRVGLGAWAIGGRWEWGWGRQDDAESVRTIHRALERGVNWIDTAPVYGLGHSEAVIGRALGESAGRPYVFTKCGVVWNELGHASHRLDRASIDAEIDDSLRRLGVDVIDLCQIHWPNPDEDVEQAWTVLAELKERGKVRHIGVSNFSVEQLERVRGIAEVTSLQPPYSLLAREAEDAILPYCREHSIGVIHYSPMASGLLAGTMSRERIAGLPDDDWRKKHRNFKEPRLSRNLELAELLREIGDGHGVGTAAVAIAWTLQHPAVTGAIVGMRRPGQVDGVVTAAGLELTPAENRSIGRFFKSRGRARGRNH